MAVMNKPQHTLYLDCETAFSTGYSLTCLNYSQYVNSDKFAYMGLSYALDDGPVQWCFGDEIEKGLDFIRSVAHDCIGVAHNMYFDGAILAWQEGIQFPRYECTKAISNYVLPAMPGSLNALGTMLGYKGPAKEELSVGLTKTYNKRLEDLNEEERESLKVYGVNDTEILRFIHKKMRPLMPEKEAYLMHHTLKMAFNPHLEFDKEQANKAKEDEFKRRDELCAAIGVTPEQLRKNDFTVDLLTKAGAKLKQKPNKNGELKYVLSKTDNELLDQANGNEQVRAILDARFASQSSIIGSRLNKLEKSVACHNGKVPIFYVYHAAHTGRTGGSNGVNMSNLPRKGGVRESIVAPDGETLVIADSAGIEARLAAYLVDDKEFTELYKNGGDTYCALASKIFGREITKADSYERMLGKASQLGLQYGMRSKTFDKTLKSGSLTNGDRVFLPIENVRGMVKTFDTAHPKYTESWAFMDTALRWLVTGERNPGWRNLKFKKEEIILPSGRSLYYPGLGARRGARKAEYYWGDPIKYVHGSKVFQRIIQALARDIVMNQMIEVERRIKRGDMAGRVVMHVYDEVTISVAEHLAEETLEQLMEIMRIVPSYVEGLPLDCEGTISKHFLKF
jgi:DNA polymerase